MNTEKMNNDSIRAESQVIGSLLMDASVIDEVRSSLMPDMFYNKILGTAYEICLNCVDNDMPFDLVSLCTDTENRIGNTEMPVQDTLMECAKSVIGASAIKKHADTVKRCYANRKISMALQEIEKNPDKAIEELHNLHEDISGIVDPPKPYDSLAAIAERNENKYFCDKPTKDLKSGIDDFDEVIGEFEGGDMIVIGARPAVGKSALAAQIVNNLSHKGAKIGYFNLEMTEKQVFERFIATESGIGLTRIRRALRFMNDEEEKYKQACERLKDKDKIIIPTGSKTVSEIRAITQKEDFDIIVVDYLQLVKADGRYRGNRFAEVGEISHGLKAIAVDFQIPVIVLTQMNRLSEGKADREPTMAEIRESGDIEQDASIVLLLWNIDEEDRSKKGFKFDKNRQGTLKKGKLKFDGDRMKFVGEDDEDFVDATDDFKIPFVV